MKTKSYIIALMAMVLAAVSCQQMDYPDRFRPTEGNPVVYSIKYVDKDYTINQAYMKEVICLLGDNLKSVNQIWFSDQQAVLNTSFITNNTLLVEVPGTLPEVDTKKIYLITAAKDTTKIDFEVLAPAPKVSSMSMEYTKPGETATIYGDFFVEPMTVEFSGGVEASVIKNVKLTSFDVVIPDGAISGPIKITTPSGVVRSSFHWWDERGLITNFDGPGNSGTKGIVPQGWNIAVTYSEEGGFDGAYAQVGPVDLGADGAWTEPLKIPWWCGNWGGDPLSITEGPGTPLRNLFPAGYFDDPSNLAFKFELFIPSSNPWSAGAMQVLFVNYQQCANDSWQNNTYIHTGANGGLDLCRGFYTPWWETGSFDTGDKWITVTMPLSEFIYNMDGSKGLVPITPESFDSFIIWPVSGGRVGTDCQPIFRYDNIRIVPVK